MIDTNIKIGTYVKKKCYRLIQPDNVQFIFICIFNEENLTIFRF